jgi:hypothetical protein
MQVITHDQKLQNLHMETINYYKLLHDQTLQPLKQLVQTSSAHQPRPMPAAPQPVRDGSRRRTESSIRSSQNALLCAEQREDTPLLHHHQTQAQDGTLQITQ